MKEKFLKFIDKFYGFFEMKSFDSENKKHKKIIQKRVDKMLSSPKMVIWIKQAYWFDKDEVLTNEVLTFLIDNASEHFDDQDFLQKINFNSNEWLEKLDFRISKKITKN
jgi:hypothetical protein